MWLYLDVLCLLGFSSLVLARSIDRSEGEICLQKSGQSWRCVREARCTASGALDTCQAAGGSRVVCCPQRKISRTHQSTEPPRERVSSKKCREYSQYARSGFTVDGKAACNSPETLIRGGENAAIKEFPHMVRLGYETKKMGRIIWKGCGGTLISEQFVLTAAHCIRPKGAPSEVKWVSFGEVNVKGPSENWGQRKVVDLFIPEGYNEKNMYNDIAILKLERAIEMGPRAHPACLDTGGLSRIEYIATGWGRTGDDFVSLSSSILQKVSLPHVPVEKCNETYAGLKGLPNGFDEKQMLCAGGIEGQDTCKGDSGGPLQGRLREPECMYSIVGITSFSVEGCGSDKPGVYTRVYGYLDWIEGIVWPNQ